MNRSSMPDFSETSPQKKRSWVPIRQRQLFLDDWGVAKARNLAKTLHQPVEAGVCDQALISARVTISQCRSAPNWDPREAFQIWMEISPVMQRGIGISGYTKPRRLALERPGAGPRREFRDRRNTTMISVGTTNSSRRWRSRSSRKPPQGELPRDLPPSPV